MGCAACRQRGGAGRGAKKKGYREGKTGERGERNKGFADERETG